MTLPNLLVQTISKEPLESSVKQVPDASSFPKDDTSIKASSLLRVLDGVGVAVKVPTEYIQALALLIQRRSVAIGKTNLPSESNSTESKLALDIALPFHKWYTDVVYCDEIPTEVFRPLADVTLAVALLREQSRQGTDVTSKTLDLIWHLIYRAITSAQGTKLQFVASRSAQGFLSILLCSLVRNMHIDELFRFHVWLPDGERGQSAVAVHSHQPFAQSWILAGSGIDRSFDVEHLGEEDTPEATHAEYELCWTDNKNTGKDYKPHQIKSTVTRKNKFLRVKESGTETHTRDMSYSVPSGAYHYTDVAGDKLHATLFFFDAQRGFVADAGVTGPKDGESFSQHRDPRGVTPRQLAQLAYSARRREQMEELQSKNSASSC